VNRTHKISTADIIAASNDFSAIKISSDNRRVFAVQASGEKANDPSYFRPLYAFIEEPASIRALYDFYNNMDIGDFYAYEQRPTTDTMKDIIRQNIGFLETIFQKQISSWIVYGQNKQNGFRFEEGILRVPTSEVVTILQIYMKEAKMESADSKTKVGMYLSRLVSEFSSRLEKYKDGALTTIVKKRSHGIGYFFVNTDAVKKFMKTLELEEDDNLTDVY
jgi:hypothetical protein